MDKKETLAIFAFIFISIFVAFYVIKNKHQKYELPSLSMNFAETRQPCVPLSETAGSTTKPSEPEKNRDFVNYVKIYYNKTCGLLFWRFAMGWNFINTHDRLVFPLLVHILTPSVNGRLVIVEFGANTGEWV